MNRFQRTHEFIDQLFELIGDTLLMFMKRVAPFLVILPPAFFLAHAVGSAATEVAGASWGLAVGITAAVALEAAGMYAPYQATQLFKRGESFWWVPALGALAYVAVGITVIWIVESISYDAKVVGTAMYIIALLVYVMLGIDTYISISKRDELAGERARAEAELELQKYKVDAETEVKIERVRAKAQQPADVQPRPPVSAHVRRKSGERNPDLDEALANVREQSDGTPLSVADVQEFTGKGRTAAYELVRYGVDTGQLEHVGRNRYNLNGTH